MQYSSSLKGHYHSYSCLLAFQTRNPGVICGSCFIGFIIRRLPYTGHTPPTSTHCFCFFAVSNLVSSAVASVSASSWAIHAPRLCRCFG